MPVPFEGTASYPKDSGSILGPGWYNEANGFFYAPRTDNATAKNLRVALYAADGSVLLGQKAMAGSVPVVLASDQASVPVASTLQAGSAVVGKVGIDQATPGTTNNVTCYENSEYIYLEGIKLQVKRFSVRATASGNTDVVAAVASKKIRVLSLMVLASAAVVVKLQSNATTDKWWVGDLGANGGSVLPRNVDGWFETVAGEKLSVNLSTTANVAVGGTYVEA